MFTLKSRISGHLNTGRFDAPTGARPEEDVLCIPKQVTCHIKHQTFYAHTLHIQGDSQGYLYLYHASSIRVALAQSLSLIPRRLGVTFKDVSNEKNKSLRRKKKAQFSNADATVPNALGSRPWSATLSTRGLASGSQSSRPMLRQ